jgi:hypothetical protein
VHETNPIRSILGLTKEHRSDCESSFAIATFGRGNTGEKQNTLKKVRRFMWLPVSVGETRPNSSREVQCLCNQKELRDSRLGLRRQRTRDANRASIAVRRSIAI